MKLLTNGSDVFKIHSDCTDFVRAIANHQQPFEISTLVHDIKALCSKFSFCEIRKVSRQEIGPAHVLATTA